MAGKDEIETAPATDPAPPADKVLAGVAGVLAMKLKAAVDDFVAAPAEAPLKTAQTITGLARASIVLHQAQAQEDKAAERHVKRAEEHAVARARARFHHDPNSDEPDSHEPNSHEDEDTDMNGRDPRLDDPDAMARVDAKIERRLAELAREIKSADAAVRAAGVTPGGPAKGISHRPGGQLADLEPHEPASATH